MWSQDVEAHGHHMLKWQNVSGLSSLLDILLRTDALQVQKMHKIADTLLFFLVNFTFTIG